jgi:hypothetical protein
MRVLLQGRELMNGSEHVNKLLQSALEDVELLEDLVLVEIKLLSLGLCHELSPCVLKRLLVGVRKVDSHLQALCLSKNIYEGATAEC